jgi:hypothetical protein
MKCDSSLSIECNYGQTSLAPDQRGSSISPFVLYLMDCVRSSGASFSLEGHFSHQTHTTAVVAVGVFYLWLFLVDGLATGGDWSPLLLDKAAFPQATISCSFRAEMSPTRVLYI